MTAPQPYTVTCPRYDADTRRWSFRLKTDDEFIVYEVGQMAQVETVCPTWNWLHRISSTALYVVILRAADWQTAMRDYTGIVEALRRGLVSEAEFAPCWGAFVAEMDMTGVEDGE